MKKFYLFAIALMGSALFCAASSTVELGQTRDQAIAALGKPIGLIELTDKTLLLYPQGELTLRDGKITEIDLMTEAEFAANQERLKLEREQWLIQQEKQAAARLEEGEALKAYKMQSGAFAKLPAKDQLDYWRRFQIRFPEVDVADQIARALEGYEVELTELKTQQRIAELEARVARAEQEAAAASLEAEKLRQQTAAQRDSNYGLRVYTTPTYHKNYYYQPPTITIYSNGETRTMKRSDKTTGGSVLNIIRTD